MPKRQRTPDDNGDSPTPRKTRRSTKDEEVSPSITSIDTPSNNRKSILRGTPSKPNGFADFVPSPSPLKKVLFSTSANQVASGDDDEPTPVAARHDRSALRKSVRTLQLGDEASEDEDAVQDERIARKIIDSEDEEEAEASAEEGEGEGELAEPSTVLDTPSKTGKPRGRPKGKRRERTPTPPTDLPPHELYFFRNRAGGNKTSTNTLPSHILLNNEDLRTQLDSYEDTHETYKARLMQLHTRAFDQWVFELSQGSNLCLYGYGSKRKLMMSFAEHLYLHADKTPVIIVANGYTPGLTMRDILSPIAGQLLPKNTKLPAQQAALLELIIKYLDEPFSPSNITLIVHSLDHANLRKGTSQAMLARLAHHQQISLIASCDTPNFPLLWDLGLVRQFAFLYHDATTFEPWAVELDVVEEVNALLGRSGRRLGGKDGVGYVLKSLPENARSLFRILVAEQLALADTEIDGRVNGLQDDSDVEMLGVSDEEEAANQQATPSRRGRGRPPKKVKAKPKPVPKPTTAVEGVEYRTLYHKAVEEFVCSSEVNFRTLLKEFHDHQMIESKKDGLGTERLIVPFRREELEAILDELV